jgi:hypothetical protein
MRTHAHAHAYTPDAGGSPVIRTADSGPDTRDPVSAASDSVAARGRRYQSPPLAVAQVDTGHRDDSDSLARVLTRISRQVAEPPELGRPSPARARRGSDLIMIHGIVPAAAASESVSTGGSAAEFSDDPSRSTQRVKLGKSCQCSLAATPGEALGPGTDRNRTSNRHRDSDRRPAETAGGSRLGPVPGGTARMMSPRGTRLSCLSDRTWSQNLKLALRTRELESKTMPVIRVFQNQALDKF